MKHAKPIPITLSQLSIISHIGILGVSAHSARPCSQNDITLKQHPAAYFLPDICQEGVKVDILPPSPAFHFLHSQQDF